MPAFFPLAFCIGYGPWAVGCWALKWAVLSRQSSALAFQKQNFFLASSHGWLGLEFETVKGYQNARWGSEGRVLGGLFSVCPCRCQSVTGRRGLWYVVLVGIEPCPLPPERSQGSSLLPRPLYGLRRGFPGGLCFQSTAVCLCFGKDWRRCRGLGSPASAEKCSAKELFCSLLLCEHRVVLSLMRMPF